MIVAQNPPSTRQQSILHAALDTFSTNGYEATSIEDICQSAPASVGSFYHHFGSKEGVAAALYEEAVDRYQTGLLTTLAKTREPRSMVAALVRIHLVWARDNQAWARFMLQMGTAQATAEVKPSVTAKNRELMDTVEAWARPHIERDLLIRLSPAALIAQILGPSYFLTKAWLAGATDITEPMIKQFAESAWQAVRADGGPDAS